MRNLFERSRPFGNWYRGLAIGFIIERFNQLYLEAGFPSGKQWEKETQYPDCIQQRIGWYTHCCPKEKQTHTMNFLLDRYLRFFEKFEN